MRWPLPCSNSFPDKIYTSVVPSISTNVQFRYIDTQQLAMLTIRGPVSAGGTSEDRGSGGGQFLGACGGPHPWQVRAGLLQQSLRRPPNPCSCLQASQAQALPGGCTCCPPALCSHPERCRCATLCRTGLSMVPAQGNGQQQRGLDGLADTSCRRRLQPAPLQARQSKTSNMLPPPEIWLGWECRRLQHVKDLMMLMQVRDASRRRQQRGSGPGSGAGTSEPPASSPAPGRGRCAPACLYCPADACHASQRTPPNVPSRLAF